VSDIDVKITMPHMTMTLREAAADLRRRRPMDSDRIEDYWAWTYELVDLQLRALDELVSKVEP
jgi:hypothetical protein